MLICDNCKTDKHYKLRCEKGLWLCSNCRSYQEHNVHGVLLNKKVKIGKTWATERQLNEMERRVILPYSKPDGGYYVGRRGDNGKIQERWPQYQS